jgi:hypothetical protein
LKRVHKLAAVVRMHLAEKSKAEFARRTCGDALRSLDPLVYEEKVYELWNSRFAKALCLERH